MEEDIVRMENIKEKTKRIQLTPKEKIIKAKEELLKAQNKVKILEDKRKNEIVNMLFKIDENIINYDDVILEKAFKKMMNELK
jgi:hypothetical protein